MEEKLDRLIELVQTQNYLLERLLAQMPETTKLTPLPRFDKPTVLNPNRETMEIITEQANRERKCIRDFSLELERYAKPVLKRPA